MEAPAPLGPTAVKADSYRTFHPSVLIVEFFRFCVVASPSAVLYCARFPSGVRMSIYQIFPRRNPSFSDKARQSLTGNFRLNALTRPVTFLVKCWALWYVHMVFRRSAIRLGDV